MLLAAGVVWLAAWSVPPAEAGVTALQQSVSPTAQYAGCKDTWISNEQWERNRHNGRRVTLTCGGQRHILLRFDLSAIPKGQAIHKAVLRLADAGFPRRGRDGKFASALRAYALTRDWDENANWLEHTRTNWKEKDAGDWAAPGGEFDQKSDFGRDQKGLIAADTLVDGPWGHMHELDVTEAVRRWHSGQMANHGFLIQGAGRARVTVASADWPVPTYRPKLLIDGGAQATGIPALSAVAQEIELDPVSQTPDSGQARGEYAPVCVGMNPKCALRGASDSTYVKENRLGFPGTWGWMNQCRAGGVAGDFNRTLLYFDLSKLPKNASIKEAKLVCHLVTQTARQVGSYRYGVYLVRLPEAPGWSGLQVSAGRRQKGADWPKGGLLECSGPKPLALGKVTQQEITVRGRKRRINAGIEFDLTGAVRAWVSGKMPNCGVVLDNRIEGGAYDLYSARALRAELRPYLQITCSPAVTAKAEPIAVQLAPPPGDYWVEPMREVHARFKGKAGTLAQYGDSITVTMAFLAGYSWGDKITARNMTPEVRKEMDLVEKYSNLVLWREWKGGGWGNTGMMRSDWLYNNIDGWQKKMNPEAAVIMFGTNDIGGLWPPQYTENMAAALRRMLEDGTVPMLTSIPPANKGGHREYWLAALAIAHGLRVPLIDYYGEIIRRRPDDWNGRLEKFNEYKGYDVPTPVSRDGTHPSNPAKYRGDWSDEALNCSGYGLRNYMTLRMYAKIITRVFQAAR
jgi:hypothetical protein